MAGPFALWAILAALIGAGAAGTASAQAPCRLALVLAMDISSSVDPLEDALQRGGLAQALRAPDVVQRDYAVPDGLWYGAVPELLVDHRGPGVMALIDRIEAAVASYPYADQYRSYPGPNSNTFIAHIGREVPALKLDLPANAIGKDYRPLSQPVGLSPSGTGVQASLLGLLGVSIGWQEGLEFNLLGLNFGLDVNPPALRLPMLGRIGMDNGVSHPQAELTP